MTDASGSATFRISAEAYDHHVGRYGGKLAAALIEMAGISPGDRVLDVGCGPGALTAALAGLVGADRVAAVDPSEPFVRACMARNPAAQVQVAASEDLPFPSASFDAALAQLVVNFMTDAAAGVREMKRVTKPGGTVAAAVWDYAGEMTFLRSFWDSAVAVDPAAAELDEGRCMSYCQPDELEMLWVDQGLVGVEVGPRVVEADYTSFDDLWEPLEAGVGPSGAYAAALPEEQRRRLRDELHRRLDVAGGPFSLRARAWCVVGRVEEVSRR